MVTSTVGVYLIGARGKASPAAVFDEGFVGWLMSDGYQVYRHFQQRRGCWVHLLRKVEELKHNLNTEARTFGQAAHDLLSDLIQAIYQAREGPSVDLTPPFRDRLNAFAQLCEQQWDSTHEKTRALAREFLNLAKVVAERRNGNPAPPLPAAA